MDPKQYKPFKLREQNVTTLSKNLGELQVELSSLRVNKVASGVASKLAKIRVVRKAIARQLTIINQKRRNELKEAFSSRAGIKKYNEENKTNFSLSRLPKDLRPRLTRALRRKISKKNSSKLLPKQQKRLNAFPP